MAAAFYAETANTDVPLWESRVDHSSSIRRVTGSELLAELQAGWANIIRRRPAFAKGNPVAYSDEEAYVGGQKLQTYVENVSMESARLFFI